MGPLSPIDSAKKDIDCGNKEKREEVSLKARGKHLVCVFMKSVSWKYHGNCIKELNGMCMAGQNNCQATMIEEVSHLSHCMDSDNDKEKERPWWLTKMS